MGCCHNTEVREDDDKIYLPSGGDWVDESEDGQRDDDHESSPGVELELSARTLLIQIMNQRSTHGLQNLNP